MEKCARGPWDRTLLGGLARCQWFQLRYEAKTQMELTPKQPSDTVNGAIFLAPFRFEISKFFLTAKNKLMAWSWSISGSKLDNVEQLT